MPKQSVNLLPEDQRKEQVERKKRVEQKPYKLHIPEKEIVTPEKKFIPQVKESEKIKIKKPAPEIKTRSIKKTEPQKPEIKKPEIEKKTEPVKKIQSTVKRKIIKQRKTEEDIYKSKEILNVIKRKKKRVEKKKPGTLEVNLIPEDLLKLPVDIFKIKVYVVLKFSFIFLALIVLSYLGLYYYSFTLEEQSQDYDQQIVEIEIEIEKFSTVKEQIDRLQQRASSLLAILNEHVYWTKFFELLENNTINDVYFNDFSAQKESKVSLSGVGKKYESVARQMLAFEQAENFIKSVEINSATASVDSGEEIESVNFAASIELVPDLLIKTDQEISPIKREIVSPFEELQETENESQDQAEQEIIKIEEESGIEIEIIEEMQTENMLEQPDTETTAENLNPPDEEEGRG